ncbi:MAG: hypothetical protein CVV39_00910 [Planctomycetes bacterium HGW-Planctomycetes-1]|nr:MAG: hypothetical protein CVV39_00910 [Planctomycetes bacterium HGW-Planctomycetes-1]
MTEKTRKVLFVTGEIFVLCVATGLLIFKFNLLLQPIFNLIFLLPLDGIPILTSVVVLVFDIIWLVLMKLWPLKNIYIKLFLTYLVLFLSGCVLFAVIILPNLMVP